MLFSPSQWNLFLHPIFSFLLANLRVVFDFIYFLSDDIGCFLLFGFSVGKMSRAGGSAASSKQSPHKTSDAYVKYSDRASAVLSMRMLDFLFVGKVSPSQIRFSTLGSANEYGLLKKVNRVSKKLVSALRTL